MADRDAFIQDFNDVVAIGDGHCRASLLVRLCKDYDLRDKAYAHEVQQIAQWIESSNDDVRREVVFALSSFRPIPGYEYIAVEGWKKAPASDLHWYASAIESSYTYSEQICHEVVTAVVEKLWSKRPVKKDFSCDLDHIEAVADHENTLSDTMRVVEYLHNVLFPNLILKDEPHGLEQHEVNWRVVAEVLYMSMTNNQRAKKNDNSRSVGH